MKASSSAQESSAADGTLPYQCPHCKSVLNVKTDLIGEEVTCPNCRNMFEVTAPRGRAMNGNAKGRSEGAAVISEVTSNERTLEVVHPAMFRSRPFVYLGWLLLIAAGAALVVLAIASAPLDWMGMELTRPVLLIAGVICAGVGAIALFGWWLSTRFRTLTITSRRVEFQRGLIARRVSEVRNEDVRNIQLDQSMLQRILGVGTLGISSAGQDDMEIQAKGIPNPEHLVDLIRAHED